MIKTNKPAETLKEDIESQNKIKSGFDKFSIIKKLLFNKYWQASKTQPLIKGSQSIA